jgi:hypothetical protein
MRTRILPWLAAILLATLVGGAVMVPAVNARSATPVSETVCVAAAPATPNPTPVPTSEPPLGVGPTPTPEPDPEAIVDPLLERMAAAAMANLEACWNARDWDAVAGIVTPRFLKTSLGIAADDERQRAAALAALDLGPLHIEMAAPVKIWSDGRGAVDVLYFRGDGSPTQIVAARWFFIAERGVARFDEETLLTPPPLGDRVMIGFAIADDVQPLLWASLDGGHVPAAPVIALHGANRGLDAHTFVLQNADGANLGILTLASWTQGDLLLRDLPPGLYRLRDPAVDRSALKLVVRERGG